MEHLFNKRDNFFLIFACLILLIMASCNDDDFATGADAQPSLSTDTLHLGTILAETSSQTHQVMLYNRCKDDLRLTSISLREAGTSGFRMNVDGMNGDHFTNSDLLRISSGDSLYIFVEATFSSDNGGFTKHEDHIDILCNGVQQSIVLQATSQDVRKLKGEIITQDLTLTRNSNVQIFDSLVIAEGVTLTLEDSVTLFLHDKTDIIVYGTLIAQGTREAPVTIRGDRTDNMFDNLPYDNLPAQWGTLYLKSSSHNNLWEHLELRGMSQGVVIDSAQVDTLSAPRLIIRSSRIKNSAGNLFTAHSATMTIENSELSNAAGSLLELYGGSYDFTHCTLANYNFASAISQVAVYFSNFDTLSYTMHPLLRCNFNNTLIWSRVEGDKKFSDIIPQYYYVLIPVPGGAEGEMQYADSIFNYRFDHCLLHADGTDDKDFINTVWNKDPMFTLIDHPNYTYDFRPGEGSPAIGAGTNAYIDRCPEDLDGQMRDTTSPTIGCYEPKSKNP